MTQSPEKTRKLVDVQRLIARLNQLGWKEGTDIWARANFCCEYCDADLLKTHEAFELAQSDHILSQRDYPELRNCSENYALACGLCHKVKRTWDANTGNAIYVRGTGGLAEEQRRELVQRCRIYVAQERKKKHDQFEAVCRGICDHELQT